MRSQDLDPMAHANNAVFVDYPEEAVLAAAGGARGMVDSLPRSLALEYLAPAPPAAPLESATWHE